MESFLVLGGENVHHLLVERDSGLFLLVFGHPENKRPPLGRRLVLLRLTPRQFFCGKYLNFIFQIFANKLIITITLIIALY